MGAVAEPSSDHRVHVAGGASASLFDLSRGAGGGGSWPPGTGLAGEDPAGDLAVKEVLVGLTQREVQIECWFGVGSTAQAPATPTLPGRAAEQKAVFAKQPARDAEHARRAGHPARDVPTGPSPHHAGATPLVVLTAKDHVDHKPAGGPVQGQLPPLSTNPRHTVANLDNMAFL